MPSPPIQLFLTTIASQPALRQKQEYLLRILQVRKIPFTSYDLASDEEAKKLWKRKAPLNEQALPGILVGGRWPGNFSQFEEAVEFGELDIFLRLKEEWDPELDGKAPGPPVIPVGVPGAASPQQMTNQKPSFAASPSPLRKKGEGQQEFDVGSVLVGYGLQGVKVTDDEIAALVEELGLQGDEASDLVKGLSGDAEKPKDEKKEEKKEEPEPATAPKTEEKTDNPPTKVPSAATTPLKPSSASKIPVSTRTPVNTPAKADAKASPASTTPASSDK